MLHDLLIALLILFAVALVVVATCVIMNNFAKKPYAEAVADVKKDTAHIPLLAKLLGVQAAATAQPAAAAVSPGGAGGTVTTIIVPQGFVLGVGNVLLQPVTPAQAFGICQAATAAAKLAANSFVSGLNWNQAEYLRQMTPAKFGAWCYEAAQLPGVIGAGDSLGWLVNLSSDGQGFFETLVVQQNLVIPAADPR